MMKRFFALCLALSLVSVASIGCDHCMLERETTGTTSDGKKTTTEVQSVESSEQTPPPAAP